MPIFYDFRGDEALAQEYRAEGDKYLEQLKQRMTLLRQPFLQWNVETPRAQFIVSSQIILDTAPGRASFDRALHHGSCPSFGNSVDKVIIITKPEEEEEGGYEPYLWAGVKVDISALDHKKMMALGEGWSFYDVGGSFTDWLWEINNGSSYYDGPAYGTATDSGGYHTLHYWGPDHYVVPSANLCTFEPGWDSPTSNAQILDMSQLRMDEATFALQDFSGLEYQTDIAEKYKVDSQILAVWRGTDDYATETGYYDTSLTEAATGDPSGDGVDVCYAWGRASGVPGVDDLLTDFVWYAGESWKDAVDRIGGVYYGDTIYRYSNDIIYTMREDIPAAYDSVTSSYQNNAYNFPVACVSEFHTNNGLFTFTMPWDPHVGYSTEKVNQFDDKNLWNGFVCLDPKDKNKNFPKRIPPYPQEYQGKKTDIRHAAVCKPLMWAPLEDELAKPWNAGDVNFLEEGFFSYLYPLRFGTLAHRVDYDNDSPGGTFTRTAAYNLSGNYDLTTIQHDGEGRTTVSWSSMPYEEAQSLQTYTHKRDGTVLDGRYIIKVAIGAGMYPNHNYYPPSLFFNSTGHSPAYIAEYLQTETPEPIPCVLEIRLGREPNQRKFRFRFTVPRFGIADSQNLSYAGWANNKAALSGGDPQDYYIWGNYEAPSIAPALDYYNILSPCNPGDNWSPYAWLVDVKNGQVILESMTPTGLFVSSPANDVTTWAIDEVTTNTLPNLSGGAVADFVGYQVLNGEIDGNWSGTS